jgi:hypothetical protein
MSRGDLLARWLLEPWMRSTQFIEMVGQEDAGDAAPHATRVLHGHAAHPVGAVEAERLREGAADDHEQEGSEGEGAVGDQADHRVAGFGGEGVGASTSKSLPKRSKIMFPIFDDFDYTRGNERWKGKSKRTVEQRRGDKADRLFEKLVKGTDFERLDGYHALRHSFISILVAQGKTWDQIAGFVGHLDQKTDAAVHPLHAEGQAGDGELDPVRVLRLVFGKAPPLSCFAVYTYAVVGSSFPSPAAFSRTTRLTVR